MPGMGFPGRSVPSCRCEVGAAILRASLGQARMQVSPKGWRQEGASPHSPARRTHVPPRFGVHHPREHLGACPECCGHDHLLPGAHAAETRLCARRWVGCCRVLPVPAPSEGCAAFCISSSHCHSNRLGAWVPAMPAPASRAAILPAALAAGPRVLPARHDTARPAHRSVVFRELYSTRL